MDEELTEYRCDSLIMFFGSLKDTYLNARTLLGEEREIVDSSPLKLEAAQKKLKVLEVVDIPRCKYNRLLDFVEGHGSDCGIIYVEYNSEDANTRKQGILDVMQTMEKRGICEDENANFDDFHINIIKEILFKNNRPFCGHCSVLGYCEEGEKLLTAFMG